MISTASGRCRIRQFAADQPSPRQNTTLASDGQRAGKVDRGLGAAGEVFFLGLEVFVVVTCGNVASYRVARGIIREC